MTVNHCGSCTLCCKLLDIPELNKPQGRWCTHCAVGTGCRIYEERPAPCRDFACVWLQSQQEAKPLPAELRPDKSKVVLAFSPDRKDVLGYCDPTAPLAWKEAAMFGLLEVISSQGIRVMFGNGRDHYAMDRGRARRAELSPPDDKGVRYFVRFLE
jgi:hypothetical protein